MLQVNCNVCACVLCLGHRHMQTTHLFGMHINSPLNWRGTAGQTINVPNKYTEPRLYGAQGAKNQPTIEPRPASKKKKKKSLATGWQCAQTISVCKKTNRPFMSLLCRSLDAASISTEMGLPVNLSCVLRQRTKGRFWPLRSSAVRYSQPRLTYINT